MLVSLVGNLGAVDQIQLASDHQSDARTEIAMSSQGYGIGGYGYGAYGTGETGAPTDQPQPIGDNASSPTDPDLDGKYEDVDGNGDFSITDVQLLFVNRDSEAVQSTPTAFDFNEDGHFSIADVQALFSQNVND